MQNHSENAGNDDTILDFWNSKFSGEAFASILLAIHAGAQYAMHVACVHYLDLFLPKWAVLNFS